MLLGWHMALADSLVPVTLVGCTVIGLTGLAAWTGLRRLEVPRAAAGAGAAALVAVPTVLTSLSNGWSTDPAALAWVAVCGALCAGALRRPGLLVPALAAAGLAAGTKTTALALTLTLIALTAWSQRGALRGLARPLAAVSLVALVVGATWYVRNLVDHGSPLWPYVTTSFGDPQPPVVALADTSFLDRPRATLDRLGDYYLETWGGAILLLAAALRRAAGGAHAGRAGRRRGHGVSLLLWAQAPLTGVALLGGPRRRYRRRHPLPAARPGSCGAGDRPGGAGGRLAPDRGDRRPRSGGGDRPRRGGRRGGGAAALAAGARAGCRARGGRRAGLPPAGGGASLARTRRTARAGAGGAGPGGTLAAPGYLERHMATGRDFESPLLGRLAADPRYRDGSQPVATTFSEMGVLAGDGLDHRLDLIGPRESCAALRARRARGWVGRAAQPDRAARSGWPCHRCLGPAALRDPRYAVWRADRRCSAGQRPACAPAVGPTGGARPASARPALRR